MRKSKGTEVYKIKKDPRKISNPKFTSKKNRSPSNKIPAGYIKTKEFTNTNVYKEPDKIIVDYGQNHSSNKTFAKRNNFVGKNKINTINSNNYILSQIKENSQNYNTYKNTKDNLKFINPLNKNQNNISVKNLNFENNYCDIKDCICECHSKEGQEKIEMSLRNSLYSNKILNTKGIGINRYNYRFYISGSGFSDTDDVNLNYSKNGNEYFVSFMRSSDYKKSQEKYGGSSFRYSYAPSLVNNDDYSINRSSYPRNSVGIIPNKNFYLSNNMGEGTAFYDRRSCFSDEEILENKKENRKTKEKTKGRMIKTPINEHNYNNRYIDNNYNKGYEYIYEKKNHNKNKSNYYQKEKNIKKQNIRKKKKYEDNEQLKQKTLELNYPAEKSMSKSNSVYYISNGFHDDHYDYIPALNGNIQKHTQIGISKDGEYLISKSTFKKIKNSKKNNNKEILITKDNSKEEENDGICYYEKQNYNNKEIYTFNKKNCNPFLINNTVQRKRYGDNYNYYESKNLINPSKNIRSATSHKKKSFEERNNNRSAVTKKIIKVNLFNSDQNEDYTKIQKRINNKRNEIRKPERIIFTEDKHFIKKRNNGKKGYFSGECNRYLTSKTEENEINTEDIFVNEQE